MSWAKVYMKRLKEGLCEEALTSAANHFLTFWINSGPVFTKHRKQILNLS